MDSAWQKAYGVKSTIWAALSIIAVVAIIFGIAEGIVEALQISQILYSAISFVSYTLNYILSTGVIYIGIKRATGQPVSYSMVFRTFKLDFLLNIIGLYLLQLLIFMPAIFICILAPSFLLYIMGEILKISPALMTYLTVFLYMFAIFIIFYLFIRMILAMAFVLDRQSRPWPAIVQSFTATRGNFLRLTAIFFLQMCAMIVSVLLLLIGTIWSVPWSYVLYGEIYRVLSDNAK